MNALPSGTWPFDDGRHRDAFGACSRPDVAHLVSQAVAADGTALAVSSADGELTFAELDERAASVADDLVRLGVRPRDLVALSTARSPAMVVGALGVLKAGAAYVSLDTSYPPERLAFMLNDCGATVVVESSPDPFVPRVLALGDKDRGQALLPPVADDPAYVIYTSGSTGRPKGVVVTQPSLVNLIRWHQDAFEVTAEDRATLMASPGFDASVWELWPYLVSGASVHVPPEQVRRDPLAWRDWLVEHGITIAFAPTAVAEQLMKLEWPAHANLRYLLTGGDTLLEGPPPGLGFTVVNNYGLTEATVVSTSAPVSPSRRLTSVSSTSAPSAPSIGRPITGAQLYVVDENLVVVTAGEPGELLVGGVSVAAGYLNRPELTADRFIDDHISCEPGARLYRTGDLVRADADGSFRFLGRIDDQVKVRGYRVETGDVAAALLRHADVRSCVVVAIGEHSADRRLAAYVVASGDGRPDAAELRAHLAPIVPDHMVPRDFVWLAELPTSPNGKIDRQALPVVPKLEADVPIHDDRSELERTVGVIVAGLLGLASVGVDDDFFLLGGHSLLGAQVIASLSVQLGVEVPLRAVFDRPSVRGLAEAIEGALLAEIEDMTDEDAQLLVTQIPVDL
jgi:amino acid adenylation domain-containing protein